MEGLTAAHSGENNLLARPVGPTFAEVQMGRKDAKESSLDKLMRDEPVIQQIEQVDESQNAQQVGVSDLVHSIDSVRDYMTSSNKQISQEIDRSISLAMSEMRDTNAQVAHNMNCLTSQMAELLNQMKNDNKGKHHEETQHAEIPRFGTFDEMNASHVGNKQGNLWIQQGASSSSSQGQNVGPGQTLFKTPNENNNKQFTMFPQHSPQNFPKPLLHGGSFGPTGSNENFIRPPLQDNRGPWLGNMNQGPPFVPQQGPVREQVLALLQEQLGPGFRPVGRPMYTKPHVDAVEQEHFPKGYRVPEFHTFSGEDPKESTIEHVARFQVQCGECGTKDEWKLRLFPNSLTGTAFTWYINLPPNSIYAWRQMEDLFHQQFHRMEPEVTMTDISGLRQLPDEKVETYLARFKKARFKCKVPLPEREFVRLATNGLSFELKKKFYESEFRDLFDMTAKTARYEKVLKEEQDRKTASRGTYQRNPNYKVAFMEPEGLESEGESLEIDLAELSSKTPYFLRTGRLETQEAKLASSKPMRNYTFDVTKAEIIFDQLMFDRMVTLPAGHKIPTKDEMKGKEYCKYHNSWGHNTNSCIVFRNDVQDRLDRGDFKFKQEEKKPMGVDKNPFPNSVPCNMVSLNMHGAPRSTPRPKLQLGAPKKPSKGRWRDYEGESDDEGLRDPRPKKPDFNKLKRNLFAEGYDKPSMEIQKKYAPKCALVCTQCGQPVKATDPQIEVITMVDPKESAREKRSTPKSEQSVFSRLKTDRRPELNYRPEYEYEASSSRDRSRMVKPRIPEPDKWTRVEHPKFPYKAEYYSRTQRRRYQRRKKAEERMQLEEDVILQPGRRMLKRQGNADFKLARLSGDEEELRQVLDFVKKNKGKMRAEPAEEIKSSRRERKPKERNLELEAKEDSPKIKILARPELVVQDMSTTSSEDSGNKKALNPSAQEFRPGEPISRSCNMVFVMPMEAYLTAPQILTATEDVEEMGATALILEKSSRPTEETSAVIILKEKAEEQEVELAQKAMFQKPTSKMANHIKPLFITGCLDGVPVSRILIDNGAAANLLPRLMLNKLGKTEEDIIMSTVTLTDFTGRVNQCQGIVILNLTIGNKTLVTPFFVINAKPSYNALLGRDWIHASMAVPSTLHQCVTFWNKEEVETVWADKRPFLASSNYAEAELYKEGVGPMKVAGLDKYGRHKVITIPAQASGEDLKALYDELIGPAVERPVVPSRQIQVFNVCTNE